MGLPALLPPTPFPGVFIVAPIPSRRPPLGPGVPTMTTIFTAASAAVVTRASAAEPLPLYCRRLIIGQLNWVAAAYLVDAAQTRVDSRSQPRDYTFINKYARRPRFPRGVATVVVGACVQSRARMFG